MPASKHIEPALSESEGALLALILRMQPVNAYQLYKTYERSPVSSQNSSKGTVYPAIKRLTARGLVKITTKPGDRGVTEISATSAGKQAVLQWLQKLDDSHIVIDDPLRTRLLSFDLLTQQQRLQWIAKAKSLVKARLESVKAFNESVDVPFQDFAYLSVTSILMAKMEWLDELLFRFVESD